jgi:hypothetical protein
MKSNLDVLSAVSGAHGRCVVRGFDGKSLPTILSASFEQTDACAEENRTR